METITTKIPATIIHASSTLIEFFEASDENVQDHLLDLLAAYVGSDFIESHDKSMRDTLMRNVNAVIRLVNDLQQYRDWESMTDLDNDATE